MESNNIDQVLTKIKLPFSILIVGIAGSGKTTLTVKLLQHFTDMFTHIYIYTWKIIFALLFI